VIKRIAQRIRMCSCNGVCVFLPSEFQKDDIRNIMNETVSCHPESLSQNSQDNRQVKAGMFYRKHPT